LSASFGSSSRRSAAGSSIIDHDIPLITRLHQRLHGRSDDSALAVGDPQIARTNPDVVCASPGEKPPAERTEDNLSDTPAVRNVPTAGTK
jgi:hypothetical protein